MHAYILQDWTTIRGSSAVLTMTQEEPGWLDLSPYQDVVFWLDVKEALNSPTITFQTSPSKDDYLFAAVAAGQVMPAAGATAPVVVSALMYTASVPLARYLRWQITSSGAWDATFRVLVAANSPGI